MAEKGGGKNEGGPPDEGGITIKGLWQFLDSPSSNVFTQLIKSAELTLALWKETLVFEKEECFS